MLKISPQKNNSKRNFLLGKGEWETSKLYFRNGIFKVNQIIRKTCAEAVPVLQYWSLMSNITSKKGLDDRNQIHKLKPKKWTMISHKIFLYNKVVLKVRRLGDENGQFQHNRASNAELGMKIYKTK
jgi:hypothetical protein